MNRVKVCTNKDCDTKEPKPFNEFYKKKNGKFGLASQCAKCQRRVNDKHQKNKELREGNKINLSTLKVSSAVRG